MDWTTFIAQVGFPIAAAVTVGLFAVKRIEKSEELAGVREQSMTTRIRQLEDKIEQELVALVEKQGEVVEQCTNVMRECVTTMTRLKRTEGGGVACERGS